MYGVLIGDCAGSLWEFPWRGSPQDYNFDMFAKGSRVTDDSVLACAIAEALMTDRDYEAAYRKYYALYPTSGFGKGFKAWATAPTIEVSDSYGNGSAMRVSPIGWWAESFEQSQSEADRSVKFSHNHPESYKAARAVAGAVYLARTGSSKDELAQFIIDQGYDLALTSKQLLKEWHFATCQAAMPVAMRAFVESTSFEDCVRKSVLGGGDSDTIAAIVGSIAEAHYGVPEDLKSKILELVGKSKRKGLLEVVKEFRGKYCGD